MIQKIARIFRNSTRRNASSAQVAAIYLQHEQLKLVLVRSADQQIIKVDTVRLLDDSKVVPALVQLAGTIPKKTPLCLVLSPERYQLLQLDKPPVAEAEILQALPWQIRDLVNFAPDDLVLDYCDVAEQTKQNQPRIQVVASQRSFLLPICQALQNQAVLLQNIQPDEWLSRNLLAQLPHAVLLLSHQPGQDVTIQIVRDGVLHVSRKLRGFQRLDQMSFSDLSHGLLDNLLLEVQRSLDFFEGQLRQPPVKEILLLLASTELTAILQYFSQNGFSQVRALDLSAHMPGLSLAEQGDYWLPLAGALEILQTVENPLETTH